MANVMPNITKAEGKTKIEAARGDAQTHKAIADKVLEGIGAGADKEQAYRAQHGDTDAALKLAATLPT